MTVMGRDLPVTVDIATETLDLEGERPSEIVCDVLVADGVPRPGNVAPKWGCS